MSERLLGVRAAASADVLPLKLDPMLLTLAELRPLVDSPKVNMEVAPAANADAAEAEAFGSYEPAFFSEMKRISGYMIWVGSASDDLEVVVGGCGSGAELVCVVGLRWVAGFGRCLPGSVRPTRASPPRLQEPRARTTS